LILAVVVLSLINVIASQTYSVRSGINIDPGIKVIRDKFNGSTTDFLRMSDEQLSSIDNMTLEITPYGKIIFNESINLSEVLDNDVVDLDRNVNIEENFVSVNTEHFTNLRKSAIISLYNLSFDNPRILKDGGVCSSCGILGYISGNLTFGTISFSNYTVEETPEQLPVVIASTGGGGGSKKAEIRGIIKEANFTKDIDLLNVKLKQGEVVQKTIKITNTGEKEILFTLTSRNIEKYVLFDEDVFSLSSGQSREVKIFFFSEENEPADVHTGKIFINAMPKTEYVNVILEIQEMSPLFDLKSKLARTEIRKDGSLNAEIEITNMGDIKKTDATLEYFIEDFAGKRIKIEEETLAIQKYLKIKKSFELPDEIEVGDYFFFVRLTNGNNIATSGNKFRVIGKNYDIYIILSVLTILLIIYILYYLNKSYKNKKMNESILIIKIDRLLINGIISLKAKNILECKRVYQEIIRLYEKLNFAHPILKRDISDFRLSMSRTFHK